MSFQQRRKYSALFESEEVRSVSKRNYAPPSTSLDRIFGDIEREDDGLPGDNPFSFKKAEHDRGDHFEDFDHHCPSSREDWDDDDDQYVDFDDIEPVSGMRDRPEGDNE